MALVGLKLTSVTPTVKVVGAGGAGGVGGTRGTAGTSIFSAVAAAVGAGAGTGTAFGGGEGITTTVYLFSSNKFFKKFTRSCSTFFSTIAHFTTSSSSNSW